MLILRTTVVLTWHELNRLRVVSGFNHYNLLCNDTNKMNHALQLTTDGKRYWGIATIDNAIAINAFCHWIWKSHSHFVSLLLHVNVMCITMLLMIDEQTSWWILHFVHSMKSLSQELTLSLLCFSDGGVNYIKLNCVRTDFVTSQSPKKSLVSVAWTRLWQMGLS